MKAELMGGAYSVALEESDVAAFAKRWPCYGERRPLRLEFSADNGDLIDIEGEHADNDESGLAALANDASLAGALALGLEHVAELRRPYSDAESVAILLGGEALGRFNWSRPLGGDPTRTG